MDLESHLNREKKSYPWFLTMNSFLSTPCTLGAAARSLSNGRITPCAPKSRSETLAKFCAMVWPVTSKLRLLWASSMHFLLKCEKKHPIVPSLASHSFSNNTHHSWVQNRQCWPLFRPPGSIHPQPSELRSVIQSPWSQPSFSKYFITAGMPPMRCTSCAGSSTGSI